MGAMQDLNTTHSNCEDKELDPIHIEQKQPFLTQAGQCMLIYIKSSLLKIVSFQKCPNANQ